MAAAAVARSLTLYDEEGKPEPESEGLLQCELRISGEDETVKVKAYKRKVKPAVGASRKARKER